MARPGGGGEGRGRGARDDARDRRAAVGRAVGPIGTLTFADLDASVPTDGSFVATFDAAGTPKTFRALVDAHKVSVRGAVALPLQGIVAVGDYLDFFTSGGVTLDADVSDLTGDGFLAFLTAGTTSAAQHLGGSGRDTLGGVARSSQGGFAVVGSSDADVSLGGVTVQGNGKGDLLLASCGPNGAPVAAQLLGDALDQAGRAIAIDDGDRAFVAGDNLGTIGFGGASISQHAVVLAFEPDGKPRWARGLAGDVTAVAAGKRRVAVVGRFHSPLDPPPLPKLTPSGPSDGVLLVYSP